MPKTIIVGHYADGTEITTIVKTLAEWFGESDQAPVDAE